MAAAVRFAADDPAALFTQGALLCRLRPNQRLLLLPARGGEQRSFRWTPEPADAGDGRPVLLRRDDGAAVALPQGEVVEALPGCRMLALSARLLAVRSRPGWIVRMRRDKHVPTPAEEPEPRHAHS